MNDFVEALSAGASFEAFETEFFQKVRPTSLIKRFETPDEIASFVAYLASPLSSGITGAALQSRRRRGQERLLKARAQLG